MLYHGMLGTTDCPQDLSDLEDTVITTVHNLASEVRHFDSIIVTGISGLLVGSPVSFMIGKPLVILRKDDDYSHHSVGQWINIHHIGKRTLFLDDFVSGSGLTKNRVMRALEDDTKAVMVGVYQYNGHELEIDRKKGRSVKRV